MTEESTKGLSYEELSRMRGEIISSFINIESGICKCIAAHYVDSTLKSHKSLSFLFELLYHDSLIFNVKKDIFEQILATKKIDNFPFKELKQLQKIRNKFAHLWIVHFDDGRQELALFEQEFDKKTTVALYDEYKTLFKIVEEALVEAVKDEEWFGKR